MNAQRAIRRYLAVKYYQEERLTIGKAAELAGISRTEFELFLGRNQIPISLLTYEDVRSDLEQMKTITTGKLSERFAGALHLSDEKYTAFQNELQEGRAERETSHG